MKEEKVKIVEFDEILTLTNENYNLVESIFPITEDFHDYFLPFYLKYLDENTAEDIIEYKLIQKENQLRKILLKKLPLSENDMILVKIEY